MQRLNDIAKELSTEYSDRQQISLLMSHIQQDLAARVLNMTPPEGWPGKNAEQRDQARDVAIRDDEACQEMKGILRNLEQELALTSASIETLEAERRGWEWTIRARLVDALGRVESNGNAPVDERAFDDVSQQQADNQAFFVGDDALADHPTPAELEDIPF